MNTYTRTPLALAGAALTFMAVVGTASPAVAAPEINRSDCEAAGGTFDRERGVKTCTTSATQTNFNIPYENDGGLFNASWLENQTWQVTTTQSQKGNGEVGTVQTTPVLVSRVVHSRECEADFVGEVDPSFCAELYPAL